MKVSPNDEVFAFGDSVVLNCTARGGPDNIFSWNYNGTTAYNQTLTITNLTVSNALTYTCTVGNLAGNGTDTTQIYLAPRFVSAPAHVSTRVNDTIRLSCLVQGNPIPHTTWDYEGQILNSEINYEEYGSANISSGFSPVSSNIKVYETPFSDHGQTVNSTVEITDIKYSDHGVYRCIASSTVGEEEFSISSNITLTG